VSTLELLLQYPLRTSKEVEMKDVEVNPMSQARGFSEIAILEKKGFLN
jgi:hypothetical protein